MGEGSRLGIRFIRFGIFELDPQSGELVRRQDLARLRVAVRRYGAASFACIHERRMVAQIFTSWNRIADWLTQIDGLQ